MALADLTGLGYFLPILSFLVVWVIVFVILQKTEFIGNKFWQAFLGLIVAAIFVSVAVARAFVTNIVIWFAVLAVCLFIILAILGFVGKDMSFMNKGVGIAFFVILILGFIVAAVFVFSPSVNPYLPAGAGGTGNEAAASFFSWFFSSQIFGAILLIMVSWVVAWILIKGK